MRSRKLLYASLGPAVAGFVYQRRRPIPLPPFLAFVLENPVTEYFVSGEVLVERLGITPGMKVLDAGCGPGRLTVLLARRVGETGEVVALDSQRAMLEKLERCMVGKRVTNVRLLRAGLGQGTLGRDAFDRVVLAMVLGEVRDREAALREIHAALKDGGILSVTEAFGDPDYRRAATVRREVEATGLRLVASYGDFPAYTLNFEKPLAAEEPS